MDLKELPKKFKPIRILDSEFNSKHIEHNVEESLSKEFIKAMKPETKQDKEFTFLMIFTVVILMLGLIIEYFN